MISFLAQAVADPMNTLAGAGGVLGAIILMLFARDAIREKREFDREAIRETQRNEREKSRDAQMDKLAGAVSNLVRITSLEVLSRPNISERLQEEVRELHRSTSPPERG